MTPWIQVDSLLGVCICALLGAGCVTQPPTHPAPAPDFHLSAADQRLSEAFAHFTQARILEADPDNTDRAIDHYLLAAEADPSQQMLYTSAAQAAIADLDVPHAIEILERNVSMNPNDSEAHMKLGAVYQLHGDRAEAGTEYQKAMALAPTNLVPYLYLADLHFGQGEDSKALDALRKGVKRVPSSTDTLGAYTYRSAKQMLDNREFDRAIPCLEFVAETMGNDGGLVHELIGEIYEAQKDMKNAMVHYHMAADATPPIHEAVIKIAIFYMPDAPDKAIETIQDALQRTEDDTRLLYALALIQREANQLTDALSSFALLRSTHPSTNPPLNETVYLNYASTCLAAGITNKAEEVLFECITAHPESHQALNFLAYTWAEQNVKLDKALSYSKQALAEQPKNGAYLDTLGWIYFKQGTFDKAIEALVKANSITEDAVITDHLGDAYLAAGKKDLAIEQWKRSLFLDPSTESVRAKLATQGIATEATPPVSESNKTNPPSP